MIGLILQCMGQSWYLALDMQLYLVSPLLIYPMWRWRRFGQAWMAFVMLACHAAIFALYIVYDFQPTFIITRRFSTSMKTLIIFRFMLVIRVCSLNSNDLANNPEYTDLYYQKPWTRAPPYLVGIWIGYYLHVTKNNPKPIPKVSNHLNQLLFHLTIK